MENPAGTTAVEEKINEGGAVNRIVVLSNRLIRGLDSAGPWVGLLFLRLLIGWEFLEAGIEKFNGQNWFANIQDQFPFPFNVIPAPLSWFVATWFELIGGAALILGLGTRFFAASLVILTLVATAAVHWPAEWNTLAELAKGYAISDKGFGNFKLPVIFLAMLIPLIFMGPGRISVDAVLQRILTRR